jgi:hypothetical protein
MKNPTAIEREHYGKLVGRTIEAVDWGEIDGQPVPILFLNGLGRDGEAAILTVLADREGSGPGFLDHNV